MKATSKILILFVLLFSTVTAYSQCETYFQKAEVLREQEKYEDAIKQYLNYKECRYDPLVDKKIAECECEIIRQKAETLFKREAYEEAKKLYLDYKVCNPDARGINEKIAECDRSGCDTYLQQAEMLFKQEKYEDARIQYLNYKKCKPYERGIDEKIAECDKRLQCNLSLQNAEMLLKQENYEEAKIQYLNYKVCMPHAVGIDNKIAECDRLIREKSRQPGKIYIGIRSFTGNNNEKCRAAETKTISAFTNDGRFFVKMVDGNSYSWRGNDSNSQNEFDYYLSGDVIYTPPKTIGYIQSVPITTSESTTITFRLTNAATGQIKDERPVDIDKADRFPSNVFPIECSIKSISRNEVEIVTTEGGLLHIKEAYNVYENTNDGGYTRTTKIGEWQIIGREGDFFKCKFKEGARTITAKFNYRGSLIVTCQ